MDNYIHTDRQIDTYRYRIIYIDGLDTDKEER